MYYSTLIVYLNQEDFDTKKLKPVINKHYNGDKINVTGLVTDFNNGFTNYIKERECTGLCQLNGGIGVITMRHYDHTPRQMGFLVHEINHYVFELLRAKGLYEHDSSTEAYTYFSGWLVEEIMTQIQKKYDFKQDDKTKRWSLVSK